MECKMPLKNDDQYRGAHAIHVCSHKKIYKHRTVITAALPLANWLVDNPDVTMVAFGKIFTGAAALTPRAIGYIPGKRIFLVLVARNAAQQMQITTKSQQAAQRLMVEISERWESNFSE